MQTAPQLTRGTWTTDPARSSVGFTIRHLGVATIRGTFPDATASIEVGDDGLHVTGAIRTASVEAGDGIRERRLREEFFLCDAWPEMTFTAELYGLAAAGETQVQGALTIRGATRPLLLSVVASSAGDGAIRLRASGELKRSDFGLEWDALGTAGQRLVADRVKVQADVVVVPGS